MKITQLIHHGAAAMKSRFLTITSLSLMIFMFGSVFSTRADDTDIYLDPIVPTGAEPLVMFTLDYRTNLGNTACQGSTSEELQSNCGYSKTISDIMVEQGSTVDNKISLFEVLRAALEQVLAPLGNIKIGFMMSHAHENNCAGQRPSSPSGKDRCSNGGYILYGFKPISETDSDGNKAAFHNMLASIPEAGGTKNHSYQLKENYFEFFRYLTGQGIYNAHNGYTDFGTSNDKNLNEYDPADPDVGPKWDSEIEDPADANNARYISPLNQATECTKLFGINFLFGTTNQDSDSDEAIQANKSDGGMGINLSGGNQNQTLQVISFMNDADFANGTYENVQELPGKQSLISYFLVPSPSTTENEWATAGGTGNAITIGSDPDELVKTLSDIFDSILSVSTTFVAPSIPVNVFNRAQALNDIYLALFEADEEGLPRWPGNLKKLVLAENEITGALELQDVNGDNAIDIDGRIRRSALTFWTDASALPPPANSDEVEGADGRSVTRGGAGQKIPGFIDGSPGLSNSDAGARQLFTQDPVDGLRPFNADAETANALWDRLTAEWEPLKDDGTPANNYSEARQTDQHRAINILRFARGLFGDDPDDSTSVLPWLMADPLHSRPLPVNYGARGSYSMDNPDIRIAAGTNNGILHYFRNTTSAGAQSGVESWGFIPQEVIPKLDRLRRNIAGQPVHPILTDGSATVLSIDNNLDGTIDPAADDQVLMFFGLRRGGKAYYALDVTNPDGPEFLWQINKDNGDFAELAQSWSKPVIGRMNIGGETLKVVVFGGGYNGDDEGDGDHTDDYAKTGKDQANRDQRNESTPRIGENDDEGNAIFIVNADTGDLIWKAVSGDGSFSGKTLTVPDMDDSVPMEVAAVDTSGNGRLDRIYWGDTGGRVWRADIASTDISNWTVSKMLDVGRHIGEPDRRFFNRPDIVQTKDSLGQFDAILIGSGDRENPLSTHVEDTFFMIKDRNTISGNPPDPNAIPLLRADLADLTEDCVSTQSCSSETENALTTNGWYMDLARSTGDAGEKNLSAAITQGGVVFFSTFAPSAPASVCDLSEGTGKIFALDLQDATPLFNYNTANDEGSITYERYDTLESGGIPVEAVPLGRDLVLIQGQAGGENVQKTGAATSWRTFWYDMTKPD